MHPVIELSRKRCVLFDGAMGTEIEARGIGPADFGDQPQINELLCLIKPDVILGIHRDYIQAGSDVIETNSFSANRIALQEYGLEHRVRELNLAAVRLAREAVSRFQPLDRRVFVSGSMGPGTKLPSLGQVGFEELFDAYLEQARALIEGGVDVIQVETTQDPLQTKAAAIAAIQARQEAGAEVAIICQGTFDTTGRMLLGTQPEAFVSTIAAIRGVDALGINCSTGPQEMYPVLRAIADRSPLPVIVLPNAGFPKSRDGKYYYDLTPEEYTRHMTAFIREFGVELVGGCCGTGPAHIKALHDALGDTVRKERTPWITPAASSLYVNMPYHQDPSPLIVGERTNASGSKAFREALLAEDMDSIEEIARNQAEEGAHMLDLNVAWAGRQEADDMERVMSVLRQAVQLPLMIDSTDPKTIEKALQNYPGKAVINSVNLDEPEKLHRIADLAHKYGAGIVVLAINSKGMAKTAREKVDILAEIVQILNTQHGIAPSDCFLDALTFTVASGEEGLRTAAKETLAAIRELKKRLPDSPTILGLSNISYGLKARPRRVLNSVFLHHALEAGLDAAILNAGKIIHPSSIPEQARKLAEDLLFDRHENALLDYIEYFKDKKASQGVDTKTLPPKERLFTMVVRGQSKGLDQVMERVLQELDPQGVVDQVLLPAMSRVGELFASGELQLPFVLRSAQVTKHSMAILEPLLRKNKVKTKGTVVLATVKGDVHDIGKNLVGIILSNSGWEIKDLGTMQPLSAILDAAKEHGAVAIGLSGLLLKSALIMKEDLQEMQRLGMKIPVLVGGAALSKRFVQEELASVYDGPVFYCRDAFDANEALNSLSKGENKAVKPRRKRTLKLKVPKIIFQPDRIPPRRPPFIGNQLVETDIKTVLACLDQEGLFRRRWRFKGEKGQKDEMELKALLNRLLDRYGDLLQPKGIMGFYPACARDEGIVVFNEKGNEAFCVQTPDQKPGLFRFLPPCGEEKDFLGLAVVTVGKAIGEKEQELYERNEFEAYFYLHGLAVEAAEATMNHVHAAMAGLWGLGGDRCKAGQGERFSIGYPACPDLEDQAGLLALLDGERIGITLTANFQMVPEASITALVFHHPQAKTGNRF